MSNPVLLDRPPPPEPPTEAQRRNQAIADCLRPRLPGTVWKAVRAAADAIERGGSPDSLSAEQVRAVSLYAVLARRVLDVVDDPLSLDAYAREQVSVQAIHAVSGCELYLCLWRRVWAVEPLPDSDLESVWGRVPETDSERRAKSRNIRYTLARIRELQVFAGCSPITDEAEAERLVERFFDKAVPPLQRRRSLELLGGGESLPY